MNELIKSRQLLALGCLLGMACAADAAENGGIPELGEVVVTATRSQAALSDAPAAVTVVNAKNIESKNVSRLGDVLDQVPSLYLRGGALGQSQGTIGTSSMSLRGIEQTKMLILLDGQPVQDANTGKMNWRIPFVDDIERVEVVPGAFSSLYGSNAVGGVINIITKQPDKREFTAKIKKGWSDGSGEDASLYFRDKTDKGLGLVVGLGYQDRDSYMNDFVIKDPVAGAGVTAVTGAQAITTREGTPTYLVGDMGKVPWRSTNATVKLFYDINARDKVYAGVSHQENRHGYTQFNTYLRNAATGAPVSSGNNLSVNGQRINLTNFDFTMWSSFPLYEAATRYYAGYDGSLGKDYLLKADLAKIERKYYFPIAGALSTWNGGAGTLSDTPNDGVDGSVQLSFPVGGNHFLVTGLALHQESVDQKVYALSNWRNPGAQTGVVNSWCNGRSTTTSVYMQDEISATDKLKVYLGGRWDDWETKGANSTRVYPTRNVSAFSPKASAVYKPAESVILRTSYGRSFRAPVNNDLYVTTTSRGITTTGDPNLQPERGTTWEVGGEFRVAEDVKLSATYYDTRLSNLIYMMQLNPANSLRINAGKAKVQGIELGATVRLAKWLELDANYAYVDSKILENASDTPTVRTVGKRLTDSPKNVAGIGLTAQQGAWSGTLNARYVGHVFWNSDNSDVVEGVPRSYDAHTLVNAKVGYAFSKMIKGAISVNNLLDKKAYSYFLLPGRNVTAEMDFSF